MELKDKRKIKKAYNKAVMDSGRKDYIVETMVNNKTTKCTLAEYNKEQMNNSKTFDNIDRLVKQGVTIDQFITGIPNQINSMGKKR